MSDFDFDLPDWVKKQLVLWVSKGEKPDSIFLRHVLENDFVAACRLNAPVPHYKVARFLFSEMPPDSWGSKQMVWKWKGLSALDKNKAEAYERKWLDF